jgi:hypothetical protein
MTTLSDTSTIIDKLGGNIPVSQLTGIEPKAVSMWRKANKFPAKTFLALNEALLAAGFKAPASLWGMVMVEKGDQA